MERIPDEEREILENTLQKIKDVITEFHLMINHPWYKPTVLQLKNLIQRVKDLVQHPLDCKGCEKDDGTCREDCIRHPLMKDCYIPKR